MQCRKIAFTICLGLAVMLVSNAALAQYQLINLDSNQAKTAKFMDPLQVNGWGLAYGTGGPFWVSDQGSGWSTLYNGAGVKQGLVVSIPSFNGAGPGQPTGIVFNGTGEFPVQGWSAFFIFATLDCGAHPLMVPSNVAKMKNADHPCTGNSPVPLKTIPVG